MPGFGWQAMVSERIRVYIIRLWLSSLVSGFGWQAVVSERKTVTTCDWFANGSGESVDRNVWLNIDRNVQPNVGRNVQLNRKSVFWCILCFIFSGIPSKSEGCDCMQRISSLLHI